MIIEWLLGWVMMEFNCDFYWYEVWVCGWLGEWVMELVVLMYVYGVWVEGFVVLYEMCDYVMW